MAAIIAITAPKEKPVTPTMTLPLDALTTDGAEPEVGDEIEHSIKGKVTKISGDTATIEVTALDGAPVEGSPTEEESETPEEESQEEGAESKSNPPNPGRSNPGRGNPGNPGPLGLPSLPGPPGGIPGAPPPMRRNPLAGVAAQRSRSRAQTAAIGAALRKRARGMPMPF